MSKRVYGICGGIACGKDEITRFIQDLKKEEGTEYTNVKYAYELKRLIAFILDEPIEKLEDRNFKNQVIPDMEITQLVYKFISPYSIQYKTVNVSSKIFNQEMIDSYLEDGFEYIDHRVIEVTPRWLMQNIGTNCFRDIISKDFWVWKTFKNFNSESRWIISDVRYPENEGKIISQNNGVLIGVKRKFSLRFPLYAELENPQDPYAIPFKLKDVDRELYLSLISDSEKASNDLSWCDYVITNDGTLDELKTKVKDLLCQI